ncbi:MAG: hypothetical protein RLZZ519_2282, partial [Bacteroidota bacterium]
ISGSVLQSKTQHFEILIFHFYYVA